jgi:hypothetical protein
MAACRSALIAIADSHALERSSRAVHHIQRLEGLTPPGTLGFEHGELRCRKIRIVEGANRDDHEVWTGTQLPMDGRTAVRTKAEFHAVAAICRSAKPGFKTLK